jgi:spore germination protein YaaH
MWSTKTIKDFIPDKKIADGSYFIKLVVYDQVNGKSIPSPWSEIGEFEYESISNEKDLHSTITQTAWIPDWDFENGLNSVKANPKSFESVSPVWFEVNEDGSLKHTTYYNDFDFFTVCNENKIQPIPSIPLFDPEILSKILNNHLDEHVDSIVEETEAYAGIDIDYEATYLKDKDLYFEFLEKLSKKLHKENKTLSVTVLSKWTDEDIYGWRSETRQVQDWKEIARYADEIRIMAYDYTGQNSYVPGPLSPIVWDELILNYAVNEEGISPDKLVLALPLYGYSFRVDEKTDFSTSLFIGGEKYGSERRILAYVYDDLVALDDKFELSRSSNEYWNESVYNYHDGRYDRQLIILDSEDVQMRKDLAGRYGIKGIAYWRLGGEDKSIFQ